MGSLSGWMLRKCECDDGRGRKAVQLESRQADYKNGHYPRIAGITTCSDCDQGPLHGTRSIRVSMLYCRKHGQLGQHPLPELRGINLARHVFLAKPDPA